MKGKKIIALTAMMLSMVATTATAEDATKDVEAHVGADLVSSYIWRGQKCGGVSIQPAASIAWKGLSLGAWGSYAISPEKNGSDEELDLTLAYEISGFHAGITDYYFFNAGCPFFKYGKMGESSHTFEANLGYDFGFLSVNWFTNFAGNDGLNKKGKRAYSSYIQLDAPFKLAKLDWNATLGVVPFRTDFYASDQSKGFHVNNVALKAGYTFESKKDISFPLSAQVIANPSSREMYFLIGGGISY